jgi:hypothetical protein
MSEHGVNNVGQAGGESSFDRETNVRKT